MKGWDEGCLGMKVGEIARLHCSPDYACGSGGFPAWGIMPNSEQIFEIEMLSIGQVVTRSHIYFKLCASEHAYYP